MDKMKRIVVFEDSSKVKFGGGQQISLLVVEILSKHFYITLVDTTKSSVFYKRVGKYCQENYKLIAYGHISDGITGKFSRFIELLSLPIFLCINLFYLYRIFKKNRNSIIYATTKKSLIYAYLCKVLFNNDFIYHAHLVEKNRLLLFVHRKILKKANSVIAVSNVVEKTLFLSNVTRVYNPLRTMPNVSSKTIKDKVIIAVFSSLVKIKGIDYFLKSKKYLTTDKDVEYWVFGEGKEGKSLKKKYTSNKILFKGFSDNVIQEMTQNISILCFPSIIEESFGLVILEAFSAGIPVIATNIGGQSELVTNGFNGFHVPIKDPLGIAEKIDYLIENPLVYNRFSINALKSLNEFNMDIFEIKIHDIFMKL